MNYCTKCQKQKQSLFKIDYNPVNCNHQYCIQCIYSLYQTAVTDKVKCEAPNCKKIFNKSELQELIQNNYENFQTIVKFKCNLCGSTIDHQKSFQNDCGHCYCFNCLNKKGLQKLKISHNCLNQQCNHKLNIQGIIETMKWNYDQKTQNSYKQCEWCCHKFVEIYVFQLECQHLICNRCVEKYSNKYQFKQKCIRSNCSYQLNIKEIMNQLQLKYYLLKQLLIRWYRQFSCNICSICNEDHISEELFKNQICQHQYCIICITNLTQSQELQIAKECFANNCNEELDKNGVKEFYNQNTKIQDSPLKKKKENGTQIKSYNQLNLVCQESCRKNLCKCKQKYCCSCLIKEDNFIKLSQKECGHLLCFFCRFQKTLNCIFCDDSLQQMDYNEDEGQQKLIFQLIKRQDSLNR